MRSHLVSPWKVVGILMMAASSIAGAVVLAPVFSPTEGDSLSNFNLTITAPTSPSVIRYTLNGTEPTLFDPVIASGGTLTVARGLTLKAKAWSGNEVSATTTATYRLTGDIAAGATHSIAMRSPGGVLAWGSQANGRLGNNSALATLATSPVQSLYAPGSPVADAAMVSAGLSHSVFLRNNQTVWAFGLNTTGALGDNTVTQRLTAVQVRTGVTTFLTGCKAVAAGDSFSAALSNSGEVYSWGSRISGRLGDGNTTGSRLVAGFVTKSDSGFPTLGGINQISLASASALAKEPSEMEALGASGFVWAWGANTAGQLGQGNTTNLARASRVRLNATANNFLRDAWDVSMGEAHSAVVRWKSGDPSLQGRVMCFGQQQHGRLGNFPIATTQTVLNTAAAVTYPVQVIKVDGSPLDGITSVAAGSSHTLALDSNGNVWAWGFNGSGALGDNGTTNRGCANLVRNPTNTGNLSNIIRIAAGGTGTNSYSLAVSSDGLVFGWGSNVNGQLGNGTSSTTPVRLPVAVTGGFDLLLNPPEVTLARTIIKSSASGSVTLTAVPTDADNNVASVQYFSQGNLIATVSSAPWSYNYTGLAAGSYFVYAVATDATGLKAFSLPTTFTINEPNPPSVSLAVAVTAPSFPGAATLTATPVDVDGDLTRVDFYCGGSLVGQLSSPPWVIHLSNLMEGSYSAHAVATDAEDLTGMSSTSTFEINYDPNSVNLDTDGDGLTDSTEAVLGLSSSDADSDGDGIPDGVDRQPLIPSAIPPTAASTLLVWTPNE